MAATSWLFNPHMDDRQVQIFLGYRCVSKIFQVINEKFIPSYFNHKAAQLQNPLIVSISCRVVLIFFYSQFFFNLDSSSEGEI